MTRAVTEFGAADARAVLARFRPPGDEQLDDDTSSADDERSVATDDAPAAEPPPREATSEADRAVIVRRYVEAAQRKVYRRTFTPQQAARGGTDYARRHARFEKEFARLTVAVVGVDFTEDDARAVLREYGPQKPT